MSLLFWPGRTTGGDDGEFRNEFCSYDCQDADLSLLERMLKLKKQNIGKPVDLYVIDFPVTDEQLLNWQHVLEMKGVCFRFVFVPRRRNQRFHNLTCFDKIDYLVCFDSTRLVPQDLFTMGRAAERERKRLWGDVNVRKIYSRGSLLPVALRESHDSWPEDLR